MANLLKISLAWSVRFVISRITIFILFITLEDSLIYIQTKLIRVIIWKLQKSLHGAAWGLRLSRLAFKQIAYFSKSVAQNTVCLSKTFIICLTMGIQSIPVLIWYRNYKLISILVPRRMVSWYYGSSITSLHCCNSIPGFQKNLGEISGFYAFGANVGAWEGGIWSMVFVPKLAQYIEMLKTLVPKVSYIVIISR